MTTKRNNISKSSNDVRSPLNPPSLYKIEYPNCRTGMFSLRAPFTNMNTNDRQPAQQVFTRSLTPDVVEPEHLQAVQPEHRQVVHPEYLHVDQIPQQEQPVYRQSSRRDAQVQCSLGSSDSLDRIAVPRQRTFVTDSYNYDDLSPRYRVQLRLQPTQPNIYEVWDVATPPPRSIPINERFQRREPALRIRSPRTVDIKPLTDDESDDSDDTDGTILYARYPRRTYLPANVRMVCVRHDANTISY